MLRYMLGQWREIAKVFSGPSGALRHARRRRACSSCSASSSRSTTSARSRTSGGTSRRASSSACRIRRKNVLSKLDSPLQILRVRAGDRVSDVSRQAEGIRVHLEEHLDRVHRPRQEAARSPRRTRSSSTARSSSSTRAAPSASRADTEQDITNGIIKVVSGPAEEGLLHAGPRREGHDLVGARRLRDDRRGARPRELHRRQGRPRADRRGARRCGGPGGCGTEEPISSRTKSTRSRSTSRSRASCCSSSIRPTKPDSPPFTNLIALAHEWGMQVGNDIVVDVERHGPADRAPTSRCRWRRTTRSIRSRSASTTSRPIRSRDRSCRCRAASTATRRRPSSKRARGAGARPTSKSLLTTGKVAFDDGKDVKGPVSDRRGGERRVDERRAEDRGGRAEAGNARRRHRRLGLRVERRARHSGQSRHVHEHDRLAVAAGEPDRDPAERSGRPARHDDRDAADERDVAVAARHSRPASSASGVYTWWRRR